MTKDGSNARKRAAHALTAAEQIPYTEALRRIGHTAASTPTGTPQAPQIRVGPSVPILTTDVVLVGHTAPVHSVAFAPDGQTLLSGGDVTARVWDLATRQSISVLTDEAEVTSMSLSPTGDSLAVANSAGAVSVWTIATGQITTHSAPTGRIRSLAFSPDGRALASSEAQPRQPGSAPVTGCRIRLWDALTGANAIVSSLPGGYDGHALAFHPDGHTLASSAGMDGTLQLLDTATGESTMLTGHSAGINAVAFSPDGRLLASASVDATIRLWDPVTWQTTAILTPHAGYVVSVGFSPDGRILASTSLDGTVRLWDPASSAATATLLGHTDFVTSVAFSPDGHTLASGSQDRTVRLWLLP